MQGKLIAELRGLIKRLTPTTDTFSTTAQEVKWQALSEIADCLSAMIDRHEAEQGEGLRGANNA